MSEPNQEETLEAIALELLDEYKQSEENVIWENSGSIDEDMKELEKEVEEYRQRIEAASK